MKQLDEQNDENTSLKLDITNLNQKSIELKDRHKGNLERREEQSKEQALLRIEMQDEIKLLREKLREHRET